ncbi:hypothetical protein [Billgrantia endophytica]|uniref:hypothetical protein n=1 Tax=Billgrantia endophytica TaxID=2033802 RepID=UPI0013FD7DE6|nr:hypothetical protein [Halomonas endophytica]
MKTTITLSAITALTTTAVFSFTGIAVDGLTPIATGVVVSVFAIAVLTPKFNKIAKKIE